MNNVFENPKAERKTNSLQKWKGKIKEILLLAILAFALIFAAWKIFHNGDKTQESANVFATENEKKVARILEEIDGVGKAEVIVYENENGVQSVVVVCEGANNFSVVMDVREAVAAALGTKESSVKIYLKK